MFSMSCLSVVNHTHKSERVSEGLAMPEICIYAMKTTP